MRKLIFFTVLLFSIKSYACDCTITNYTNAEKYDKYDFIVSGSVIKIEHIKSSYSKQISFKVYKTYKGKIVDQMIQIWTSESGISCGLEPSVGGRWLIYGFKKNDRFMVSVCSDSKLLDSEGGHYDKNKIRAEIDFLDSKHKQLN